MAEVTIVRTSAAGVDAYGDPLPATVTRIPLRNAWLAPRTSSESAEPGREGVIIGATLYVQGRVDLRRSDQIDDGSTVYQVEGDPGYWPGAGLQVALRRAEG